MTNRIPHLLALAVLLVPTLTRAGQTTHPLIQRTVDGNLSIERAVDIALHQNPELLKAIQEIERTRGQVIEIRAQALPHLTATANYTQQDPRLLEGGRGGSGGAQSGAQASNQGSNSGNQQQGQNSANQGSGDSAQNGQSNTQGSQGAQGIQGDQSTSSFGSGDKSWRVAFEVRQVLYAGGQVRAALKIAKFTEDSSYWNLRDVVDRVISQVRSQFYSVLLNRALITVQEESIRLTTGQLEDQRNRFEAGTVPRFNVLRSEVELSNTRPLLIRARNNYLISQFELARTLGADPGPIGKPEFNVVGDLTVPFRKISLENALQLAKERRPFLKVQRQNILIEAEQIKVALAGYKPRLDANAGYEFRNSRLSDDLGDVVNGWFFGVTGRWEIFDGLATYGRTKQARARLESAKINYDDSVHQTELEVQQAFANLQQARETIQSQSKGVEQALESLRLASERLAAGAGTQLEVLDTRVALTRARSTELQARSDYVIALAEFDRVTGANSIYKDGFLDPLVVGQKPPGEAAKATR